MGFCVDRFLLLDDGDTLEIVLGLGLRSSEGMVEHDDSWLHAGCCDWTGDVQGVMILIWLELRFNHHSSAAGRRFAA